jgi:C-1 hydroxylase
MTDQASTPTTEQMRAYPHRMYDLWNRGEMEAFYALLDDDVVDHNAAGGERGIAGVRSILDQVRTAFPDMTYRVDDVLVDGDKLAVRLTVEATHTGEFFGHQPTGRHASWTETRVVRIRDGKTVEHWANIDSLGMMRQLGLIGEPGRDSW